MDFTVAILGRPNTGKSSLFNRIIGRNHAITDNQAGSTRDRLYAKATWLNKKFNLIDTGGIEISDAPFLEEIKAQAIIAIEESDLILMVVDGKTGLTNDDKYIANLLLKTNKKVLLVVNKIDTKDKQLDIYEFYNLGLGTPYPVSSLHGQGIGNLLDEVIKNIPNKKENKLKEIISFSLIGRPNVGKSSLANAILNEDRVIVSNISGTTRDAIDTKFRHNKKDYIVIDTAGIKKRGRIYEDCEKYAILRTLKALEQCDIALFLIDANEGIITHDKNVAGYIKDYNKACIIVCNKWDLVKKDSNTMNNYKEKIKEEFKFLDYAPVVFLSAKLKEKVEQLFPLINKSYTNYTKEFKTSTLNNVLQETILKNPPKTNKKGVAKFYYITQTGIKPPSFNIYVNDPEYVHFSYKRYIENEFRKNFDLLATPIKLEFIKRS